MNRQSTYRYRDAQVGRPKQHHIVRRLVVGLVILAVLVAGFGWHHHNSPSGKPVAAKTQSSATSAASQNTPTSSNTTTSKTNPPQPPAKTSVCTSNATGKLILVSISKRHLWACNGTTVAYDSSVITGMEQLAADLTPTGTYHIYGKSTNLYLKGSDSTGSWNDYVNYWMPFLHNKYGSYGFHDATWRPDNAFGNIDPNSDQASHGCVETPLATAKWLYNWAPVGTTVTVES